MAAFQQDPCIFVPAQLNTVFGYEWGSRCAEINQTDWNAVRDRYGNYGTLPNGNSCPHSSDFVGWFDGSWNGDTYKLEFDWLRNDSSQYLGGVHHPHDLIAWRDDHVPDYLLHEVIHHRLGDDENMVLDSVAAFEANCVKQNKPERPKGSTGGGGGGGGGGGEETCTDYPPVTTTVPVWIPPGNCPGGDEGEGCDFENGLGSVAPGGPPGGVVTCGLDGITVCPGRWVDQEVVLAEGYRACLTN